MISRNETAKGIDHCFSVLRGLLFSVLMIAMIQTIESSKNKPDVSVPLAMGRSTNLTDMDWESRFQ